MIIRVPVLSPTLSSHWVGVVTPVPGALAKPLVESLKHEVVLPRARHRRLDPRPPRGTPPARPTPCAWRSNASVTHASTRAGRPPRSRGPPAIPCRPTPTGPAGASTRTGAAGGRRLTGSAVVRDRGHRRRERVVLLPAGLAGPRPARPRWSGVSACGGADATPSTSTSASPWTSGGSRSASPSELLRLRAEMRLPGLAWLDLQSVEPASPRRTAPRSYDYEQRALFHPRGLLGHAYWWSVAPSTASCSARWCATSPGRRAAGPCRPGRTVGRHRRRRAASGLRA